SMNLLAGMVRRGVSTRELDQAAERFIRSQGAEPAFKGYRGFPGSLCTSPNSMIVHGIPGPYKLGRGDILSVDVGVVRDGWVADAARTFPVGPISPIARKLLTTTEEALFLAVEQCLPGRIPRRPLRVHCRDHRCRAPNPDPLARGRRGAGGGGGRPRSGRPAVARSAVRLLAPSSGQPEQAAAGILLTSLGALVARSFGAASFPSAR